MEMENITKEEINEVIEEITCLCKDQFSISLCQVTQSISSIFTVLFTLFFFPEQNQFLLFDENKLKMEMEQPNYIHQGYFDYSLRLWLTPKNIEEINDIRSYFRNNFGNIPSTFIYDSGSYYKCCYSNEVVFYVKIVVDVKSHVQYKRKQRKMILK